MMKSRIIRTYSELITFPTFEERFEYLKLDGIVGVDTFGFDRIFNQMFYNSRDWKAIRNKVILRDNGCDLGVEGYEIFGRVIIHHLNPIDLEDIELMTEILLNPEYLISTTIETHNAIHYGDKDSIAKGPISRTKNDTCPWRH